MLTGADTATDGTLDERLAHLCLEMSQFADRMDDEVGLRPAAIDTWCMEIGDVIWQLRGARSAGR